MITGLSNVWDTGRICQPVEKRCAEKAIYHRKLLFRFHRKLTDWSVNVSLKLHLTFSR